MNKPKLIDFYIDNKMEKGIDFASYAFALEDYIRQLEKQLKAIETMKCPKCDWETTDVACLKAHIALCTPETTIMKGKR